MRLRARITAVGAALIIGVLPAAFAQDNPCPASGCPHAIAGTHSTGCPYLDAVAGSPMTGCPDLDAIARTHSTGCPYLDAITATQSTVCPYLEAIARTHSTGCPYLDALYAAALQSAGLPGPTVECPFIFMKSLSPPVNRRPANSPPAHPGKEV